MPEHAHLHHLHQQNVDATAPKKPNRSGDTSWVCASGSCVVLDEFHSRASRISDVESAKILLEELTHSDRVLDPSHSVQTGAGWLSVEDISARLHKDRNHAMSASEAAAIVTIVKALAITQLLEEKQKIIDGFKKHLQHHAVGLVPDEKYDVVVLRQKKIEFTQLLNQLRTQKLMSDPDYFALSHRTDHGELFAVYLALKGILADTSSKISQNLTQQRAFARSVSYPGSGIRKSQGPITISFGGLSEHKSEVIEGPPSFSPMSDGLHLSFDDDANFIIAKASAHALEKAMEEYAHAVRAKKHEAEVEEENNEAEIAEEKEAVHAACVKLNIPESYVQILYSHLEQLSVFALEDLIKGLKSTLDQSPKSINA